MTFPAIRSHRLVPRGGAGLVCDDQGLALGPLALADREIGGTRPTRYQLLPLDKIEEALRLAYGSIDPESIERYCRGLARVTVLMSDDSKAEAAARAVLLGLPDIEPEGMAKLAHAAAMQKIDPHLADQPRVPAGSPDGGQWTSAGGKEGKADDNLISASVQIDPTVARKEKFVDANLAAAQKIADQLGVPVENILGISALESGWGERLHPGTNNFFGIHYPAPYATGWVPAQDKPNVHIATFTNYEDSAKAFAAETRSLIQGVSDPATFARALQDSGKFGIDTATGKKMPTYVGDVAATIRGLRPYVARHRV